MKQPIDSSAFIKADKKLNSAIRKFRKYLNNDLKDKKLLPSAQKLMKSLDHHWEGLTIFVGRSDIPMDNNKAENGLRKPVVGRKGYYGSGSIWSSELAAILFTIFATLECWSVNAHTWLLAYFHECAMSGSAPPNIEKYLPWNMSQEQLHLLSEPPAYEDTS